MNMKPSRARAALWVGLLLVACVACPCGGATVAGPGPATSPTSEPEEEKKKEREATADTAAADDEKPVLYTNEDLERLFGPSPPSVTTAPGEPDAAAVEDGPPDPIKAMQDEQAREVARRRQALVARREVTELEARVKQLEQRLLRVRNPLLPRPELTPEEEQAWEGLDNAERARLTEKQLVEARQKLAEARARLEQLR